MAEKKEPEVKAEAEVKETKTKKAAAPKTEKAPKAEKAEKKTAKADDGRKLPNLKAKYQTEVAPALMQKFGYKSVMQIPRLDKIVVNCGCGEARENAKVLEAIVGDLTKITGQKAIITKAKKSVANFKLREEMPIGAKVTLRGDRMWEFLDRLFKDRKSVV